MTEPNDFEKIMRKLLSLIPKEELEAKQDSMYEFSSDFMGFVDIYYYLSTFYPE